jgi:hypothetical protein
MSFDFNYITKASYLTTNFGPQSSAIHFAGSALSPPFHTAFAHE